MKRALRGLGLVATSAMLVALGSQAAFADNIVNTIQAGSGDVVLEILPVAVGNTGTTTLWINGTNSDGDNGCNLETGDSLVVKVNSSNTAVATVTPQVTFSACGLENAQTITVTGVAQGVADISATVFSGADLGESFDTQRAAFTAAVDSAPAVTATTPSDTATGVPVGSNITINFSEPVAFDTGQIASLECPSGTARAYTQSTTSTSLTIDPTANLPSTATCVVTVNRNKVTDADTVDQAYDKMLADYSFSFTTASPPPSDSTGPVITPNVAGTLGSHGWYTSDATVSWTVSDPESSISSSTGCGPTNLTIETTGTTLTCSATSAGGTSTNSVTIKLDKTGPSAALAVTAGTLGANGWYTSNVTVSTSGSDSISGPVTCTGDQSQTTETAGQTFNGSCTNDAGLTTDAAPFTVKLDKTGPSAALAVTAGTLGANGWYTSDVTVSTSGSDSISGPVTCTGDQSQTTETAGQTFNGSCTNDAGLTTDAAPLTVKLDKTAPGLIWNGGPADGGTYYFGFVPDEPTCTATDTLSGPDGCTVTGYSAALGSHDMTAEALDKAGNSTVEKRSYSVNKWTLKGFYQPVDLSGALNIVKAGSTVPLKFEVFAGSTELTDTAVVDTFKWGEVSCTDFTGAAQDDIEQYTSGQTVLRYDTTGGQFIQNWQTPKKAGFCYRVTMTTDDGSQLSANFKLK